MGSSRDTESTDSNFKNPLILSRKWKQQRGMKEAAINFNKHVQSCKMLSCDPNSQGRPSTELFLKTFSNEEKSSTRRSPVTANILNKGTWLNRNGGKNLSIVKMQSYI